MAAIKKALQKAAQKATVNIGMDVFDGKPLTPTQIVKELESRGVKVEDFRILQSGTEPTVVAQLDRPLTSAEGDAVSRTLKQEAIAQKTADGGDLFGPKASEWGPFSEEYFISFDAPGFFPEQKASALSPREQGTLERFAPPRGEPASVPPLFDEGNKARLQGLVDAGIEQGADKWYHTGGIKDEFIRELGPEQGAEAFDRFMDVKAATSPRSAVDQNLKRASVLHQRGMRGESLDVGPEAFPKGYGHMAHRTAHQPGLKRLQETGQVGSGVDQPKVASYAENLKGNLTPVTVDTHNQQILSGVKKSPTAAQYPFMESRQAGMASELGLDPAEFQSALWAGAGDITGVRNVSNVTDALNTRIKKTAVDAGIPEDQAAKEFIRGERLLRAAVPAAALGGGVLATPEGNEAMAGSLGKSAQAAVNKARNAAGRYRRGGYTEDQTREAMMKSLDQLEKLVNSGRIQESSYQQAREAIFNDYAKVRSSSSADTRGAAPVEGELYDPTSDVDVDFLEEDLRPEGALDEAITSAFVDPNVSTSRMQADAEMDALERMKEASRREAYGVGPLQGTPARPGMATPLNAITSPGEVGYAGPPKVASGVRGAPPARTGIGGDTSPVSAQPAGPSSAGMGPTFVAFPGEAQAAGSFDVNTQPKVRWSAQAKREHPGLTADQPEVLTARGKDYRKGQFAAKQKAGEKMPIVAAGAPGMGAAIADDAPDPGVLADPTLEDHNGRITSGLLEEGGAVDRAHKVFMDLPAFAVDVAQDLGSKALAGWSGIGTLMMGGDTAAAVGNIAATRGGLYDEAGGDNAVIDELTNILMNNPRALQILEGALNLPAQAGESIYQQTGNPAWAAAGRAIPETFLEVM